MSGLSNIIQSLIWVMTSGAIWSTIYGTKTSSIEKRNSENDGFVVPNCTQNFPRKIKKNKNVGDFNRERLLSHGVAPYILYIIHVASVQKGLVQ